MTITPEIRKSAKRRIKVVEDDQDFDTVVKLTFYENVASGIYKTMEDAREQTINELSTAIFDRLDEFIPTFN